MTREELIYKLTALTLEVAGMPPGVMRAPTTTVRACCEAKHHVLGKLLACQGDAGHPGKHSAKLEGHTDTHVFWSA